MTDNPESAGSGIPARQAEMNARIDFNPEPTAEERAKLASPDELADAKKDSDAPLPVGQHKPPAQQFVGAAVLVLLAGALSYLVVQGRLSELRPHLSLVLPLALVLATYAVSLLLPTGLAANLLGAGARYPRTMAGHDYAGIIRTDGDLDLIRITGPAVYSPKPTPAIYDATVSARVRVTKTIRANTYLTIFNQGNPQPVNAQTVRGYTAEFVYNLIGGTASLINGAWAAAVGLVSKVNKKRLLLILAALVLLYFGYKWYDGRFG